MKSAFRKISRVGSLTGGTKWYLSEDCLLAAKRVMYAVEYRRFYLRDLEYIVIWPRFSWLRRLIIPTVLLAGVGFSLWYWVNSIAGEIFTGLAFAWMSLELALGPTATSRIHTTGATVDLPLVKRTRRARKVLAKIDAVVRAERSIVSHPAAPATSPVESQVRMSSEASATESIGAATQTNGS